MQHRVGLAGAVEWSRRESFKTMVGQLQAGVLAGDEQPRGLAKGGQGLGNRTELDGFGTRSNNQRDT